MASVGAVASSVNGGENTRLAFFTAEPHVERMCVDRYGNVGIGTASPTSDLHITNQGGTFNLGGSLRNQYNSVGVTAASVAVGYNTGSGPTDNGDGTYTWTLGGGDTNGAITLGYTASANEQIKITFTAKTTDTTSPSFRFENPSFNTIGGSQTLTASYVTYTIYATLPSNGGGLLFFRVYADNITWNALTIERADVFSGGNVGIGTTNPNGNLHIMSDLANASSQINPSAQLVLHSSLAGLDDDGDIGASLVFTQRWLDSSPNSHGTMGSIHGFKDLSAGNYGGGLLFKTQPGSDTSPVERMRIDRDGNVGIGTTGPDDVLDIRKGTGSDEVSVQVRSGGLFIRRHDTGGGSVFPLIQTDFGMLRPRLMMKDTGNTTRVFISGDTDDSTYFNGGNVGIGTTSPISKLHVNGRGTINFNNTSYYIKGSTSIQSVTANGWGVSIYGSGDIVAGQAIASNQGTVTASDKRIKKNIVDADDAECLETLRLLKPKKYRYKDEVSRGQEPVWGFIAQEVRETLPHATQLRQDVLPNIYELANVSQSNVITFTNFNTSNLESNATTLIRTKGIDGEDHDIHLAEVIDEHTIRVEEDLSAWIGSVDAEGNVITQIETTTLTPEEYEGVEDTSGYVANISGYQNANVVISVEEYNALEDTTGYEEIIDNYTKTVTTHPGTQLFVYGQEVDDFIFVKKEAIWTIATSALQEVDRQLQAEKAKVATLETQLASVLARLDALENP
jgi:hypothetical protein